MPTKYGKVCQAYAWKNSKINTADIDFENPTFRAEGSLLRRYNFSINEVFLRKFYILLTVHHDIFI